MRVNGPKLDSFSVWSILCGNLVGLFFVLPLFSSYMLKPVHGQDYREIGWVRSWTKLIT